MSARAARRVIRILGPAARESATLDPRALEAACVEAMTIEELRTFFPRQCGGTGGIDRYRAFLAECYAKVAPHVPLETAWKLYHCGWDDEQPGAICPAFTLHGAEEGRGGVPRHCRAYLALARRAGCAPTLARLLNLLTEHVMPAVLMGYRLSPHVSLHCLLEPGRSNAYRYACRAPHSLIPIALGELNLWGHYARRMVARHYAASAPLLTNEDKRRALWRERRGVRGFGGRAAGTHGRRMWTALRAWDLVTHDADTERRAHQLRAALALLREPRQTARRGANKHARLAAGRTIRDMIPRDVREHIVRVYV